MPARSRRLAGVLAAVTLAGSALLGTASSATAQPAVDKCGFYKDAVTAWYNHCTTDGSHIWVYIDYVGESDKERCLGPGITDIGGANGIKNAWYTGRLCNP
ncbi:DUF6355 family natural product biosynthesis protein [Streptomyces albus]|uniref:DUF6355 family natural product biosynthesis protein n=1 Tax=Streptomyces albus TaxID=1888 RepID=UPI0033F16B4B